MRVSLSMIAKDCETSIARALLSVAPWVDELIVLDTGSSDNTVQRAISCGATVFHSEWDGFSSCRNRVIDRCTGDWILVVDSDEELTVESGRLLRSVINETDFCGFRVRQRNLFQDGAFVDVPVVRLFPNDPNIRFTGDLHERVFCDLPHYSVRDTSLIINHWGAQEGYNPNSEKFRRYEAILRNALEREPNNALNLLHLGIHLNHGERWNESLICFERALGLSASSATYLPLLFEAKAICLYELGRVHEAAQACRDGLELSPLFPSLLYNLGLCHWKLGHMRQARKYAKEAIRSASKYRGALPIDGRIATQLGPTLLRASQ